MRFRQKLTLSFAAVLVLTILVGTISWIGLTRVNQAYENLIQDRVHKILLAKNLGALAADQTKNVRGYLLTGNNEHFVNYEKDRAAFKGDMQELQASITSVQAKEYADQLLRLEKQYAGAVNEIAVYKYKDDAQSYIRLVEEKCVPLALEMAAAAEELENYQQAQLNQTVTETAQQVQNNKGMVLGAVLLALLVGALMAFFIIRMIARPVTLVADSVKRIAGGDLTAEDVAVKQQDEIGDMARAFNDMKHNLRTLMMNIDDNALQVASASKELSGGSGQAVIAAQQIAEAVQGISETADNQVARIRENKLAMEESAAGIQRIAQSAAITVESAERADQEAQQGRALLEETVAQLKQIQSTMGTSAAVINELGEQSKQIEKISIFIKEIATQTNLLSLNASIEAARAGEHGKGFAVVAEEVKKLAEQTGYASGQIADGIRSMVEKVGKSVDAMKAGSEEIEAGTRAMDRTGEAFDHIYKAVGVVAGQAQEVSAATEELSAVTEQLLVTEQQLVELSSVISDQSQNIAAVCEEQLASMEEIAASSESLDGMAAGLQDNIHQFKFHPSQDLIDKKREPQSAENQLELGFNPAS
ncbi:methyl-accepting chemotaxis protein [Paenibacillus lutrae]|uniref:HAMP domain-containing protein n=1 Tax=Paenibacillus lutrae TaxID=2078573 RepID=A0A7X3JZZ0_9BACL|nr:methyl-accepting chemotaxis protein [Paenibacillus lutrae]MVP00593.1 HAMP domain-containing protein [Paenibacillus lutrae]